jgi:hypothetical protein
VAPNVPLLHDAYRANARSHTALTADLVPALRAATTPGDRVLFLSGDPGYNDYLANYLVTATGLRAFNAGGDKNSLLALRAWPPRVSAAAVERSPDAVRAALVSHELDVVVAPYFDLRWAAYAWPPPEVQRRQVQRLFAALLRDRGFQIRRFRWFATLRLDASPTPPPAVRHP